MSSDVFANQIFCPEYILHNVVAGLLEERDLKFQQDFRAFYGGHFATLWHLIKIDYIFNTDIEQS